MRVVAWSSFLSAAVVLAACGGYTNLGNGPEGSGGEDDGSGGSSVQSGGLSGMGSGKGGASAGSMGTAGASSTGMSGTPSTGSGGGGTPMTACAGRPCGSPCALSMGSEPDGREGDGDGAAPSGFCAADGSCSAVFPMCTATECSTGMDCPTPPPVCNQCADGSAACLASACIGGRCVIDAPSCADECETSMDCDAAVAPCQACPNGSVVCPRVECVMGRCAGSVPGCDDYEPCAGLSCGEVCSPCPPDDMDCPVTQVLSTCNAAGICQTGTPSCGSGNACMSAADCPQVELCYACPDGSCGEIDCVNGACGFVCPEPSGACMTAEDCGTPPPVCQDCGDGTCAVMACVDNACRMICEPLD